MASSSGVLPRISSLSISFFETKIVNNPNYFDFISQQKKWFCLLYFGRFFELILQRLDGILEHKPMQWIFVHVIIFLPLSFVSGQIFLKSRIYQNGVENERKEAPNAK
jgi:hypothetical protein